MEIQMLRLLVLIWTMIAAFLGTTFWMIFGLQQFLNGDTLSLVIGFILTMVIITLAVVAVVLVTNWRTSTGAKNVQKGNTCGGRACGCSESQRMHTRLPG